MKKANLSLNTIVMAVLAVTILVVLIFVFLNNIQASTSDLNACPKASCQSSCDGQGEYESSKVCYKSGEDGKREKDTSKVCCLSQDSFFGK